MRRYIQVSGAFFALLAVVQVTRIVFGWPIRVGDVAIPLWPSGVAFLITSTFAIWAFRTARGAA